jgi:hypothetical protein
MYPMLKEDKVCGIAVHEEILVLWRGICLVPNSFLVSEDTFVLCFLPLVYMRLLCVLFSEDPVCELAPVDSDLCRNKILLQPEKLNSLYFISFKSVQMFCTW